MLIITEKCVKIFSQSFMMNTTSLNKAGVGSFGCNYLLNTTTILIKILNTNQKKQPPSKLLNCKISTTISKTLIMIELQKETRNKKKRARVAKQTFISFKIGNYVDAILCDILPMDACHIFLGRPWRPYAKTVFINTQMGSHILKEGWDNWKNPANETGPSPRAQAPSSSPCLPSRLART